MDNKFKKIIETARTVKLNSEKKQEIKGVLLEVINKDINLTKGGVRKNDNHRHIYQSPHFWLAFSKPALIATALVMILAVTSISAVAEDTLPGEFLYPVKIYFNEGIKRLTITSPEKQAQFEVDRVKERLEEIKTLKASDKLNIEIWHKTEKALEKQTERAKTNIEYLVKKDKLETAVKMSFDLEDQFKTYSALNKNEIIDEKINEDDGKENFVEKKEEYKKVKEYEIKNILEEKTQEINAIRKRIENKKALKEFTAKKYKSLKEEEKEY